MFGSTTIDLAIGIIFVFLAVSLVSSTVTEAIASAFKLRSKTLLSGIKDLLNDNTGRGLARELYNHALINPRSDGKAQTADAASRKPAYIDPADFAAAMLDILEKRDPATAGIGGDEQLNVLLSGMLARAGADPIALKAELASWFDNAMDRVSGAYKRQAQLWNFLIALALAGILNVDMLRVAAHLYQRPELSHQITEAQQNPADAQRKLDELGLPIGWLDSSGRLVKPHPWIMQAATKKDAAPGSPPDPAIESLALAASWLLALLGWFITAAGTMFGAPFWFDMLKMFVSLRGTGPKPDDKKKAAPPQALAAAPGAAEPFAGPALFRAAIAAPSMTSKAAAIIAVCEHEWPNAKSDCSLFVRNVATQFGAALTGNADAIVDQISGTGWQPLADGSAAATAAAAGELVIAGLKGADQQQPAQHGHVVVVVAGPLAHGRYPTAYWGRLGGIGAKNTSINWAWRPEDRDNVIYASRLV